ncbi:MAG: mechanosensitive ion channel [Candidatus Hydrogenedentes bacterium]|nr:mechanosensitive ion channel [Candidatus Hydrogenedentota bacterium]
MILLVSAGAQSQEPPKTAPAPPPPAKAAPAVAAPAAPAAAAPAAEARPTSDFIQSRIAYIQGLDSIEGARKDEILGVYREALNQVQSDADWSSKAAPFGEVLEKGSDQLEKLQLDTLAQPQAVQINIPQDATLLDLSHQLLQAEEDMSLARATQSDIEQELTKRGDRRKELPDLMLNARQRLRDLQPVTVPADASEPDKLLLEARKTLADAQRYAIESESDALDKELQSFDIRGQLLKVRLDAALLDAESKEKVVALWRDTVSARRQADARKAAEQARTAVMDAAKASPVVRQYAERLAAENAALVLKTVKDEFGRARQKAESLGSSNAVGLLLRQSRAHLPDVYEHHRALRTRQSWIAKIQTERLDLGEQRAGMASIENTLRELVPPTQDPELKQQQTRLSASLRGLLKSKRGALDALMDDYDALFEKLVDADAKERELVAETEQFGQFIDERVLWIQSSGRLGWEEIRVAGDLLKTFADPRHDEASLRAIWAELAGHPVLDGAVALALALLVWFHRWLAGRLAAQGVQARKATCTLLRPTLRAMGLTLLLALPWPLLLWLIGDRLTAAVNATDIVRIAGAAAKDAAWMALALSAVRQFLFPGGLAGDHLGWAEKPVRALRWHVTWLLAVAPALVFLLSSMGGLGDERLNESLGRFIYLVLLAVFALFAHAVLRPTRGAIPQWYALRTGAKSRYQTVFYAIGVVTPLVLGLFTALGYFYTAHRLGVRLFETTALIFGIGVARGIVSRWLLLARRRLAMDRLRAQRLQAQTADDDDIARDDEPPEIELGRIDLQMNRLIKSVALVCLVAATWVIWSREMPAARAFTQIEIWPAAKPTPGAAPASGQTGDKSNAQPAPSVPPPNTVALTAGDLLLACILAGLTLAAARNIPGLLDLTILKRTHYMRGDRYAITMVVRYTIILVGGTLTFHALGIGWSKVQWLVAALGVGLGFGLQEIFANFISGIIILVERPIRVGDIVTVGGISGTVSRIRIRATWITDFSRKELIVPNKEFITNQVMNWTLSDSVLRVVIPVGIAYDADPEQAEAILRRLAHENPHILSEPAPVVVFAGFGESTLNFELRVYCDDVEAAMPVQHGMNMAIFKAFREAGIEMAYPQRDVNIRSVSPSVAATYRSKPNE